MPIKPENRARYPADWPAISLQARERAKWRCQWPGCSARHHAVGRWRMAQQGWVWHPICGSGPVDAAGWGQSWPDLQMLPYREAKAFAEVENESLVIDTRAIVIVLTVAHLNHQPEDCRPENLAAMCQRHHLAYDHQHHMANARTTRRARLAIGELF